MKQCYKCKQNKSLDNFHKNRRYSDGLTKVCKECLKIYNTKRYKQWKDRIDKRNDIWKLLNKDYTDRYNKKYYQEHKERWIKYNKNSFENQKAYYLANRERLLNGYRLYYRINSEKINTYRRERYHSDIVFRLKANLRSRLVNVLKGKTKTGSAIRDLGCSVEELVSYLESKFQLGMSWENYGREENQWSIDHIQPLSSFNLEDREQFLKACHYTNLQPMWHKENIKKGQKK